MILDRLKEDFPKEKFVIKKVNTSHNLFIDDHDLKIRWDSIDGKDNFPKGFEDILYKNIVFKVKSFLYKRDNNGKKLCKRRL